MAFTEIPNVIVRGISACVPSFIDENRASGLISREEMDKLIASTGVERKRIADADICTSDLCYKAAEQLIKDLSWKKNEIDCLIFVSQTPDYLLPATSCLLQDRLGLSKECFTLDISLGCSGWVYGMSVISLLLSFGGMKKGLLLVGDTTSKIVSPEDKGTWPLFGDAGTVTALEHAIGVSSFKFHLATDGDGYQAIIIPDGRYRNGFTADSLKKHQPEEGVCLHNLRCRLNGMDVFSFAMSKAPQSVNRLLTNYNIDKAKVDCFVFHQANLFLNETIRKKLNIDKEKVPYSLKDFGNTSSATIPLTLVTERKDELRNAAMNIMACAFGVGLSWGSLFFTCDRIVCSDLIEY